MTAFKLGLHDFYEEAADISEEAAEMGWEVEFFAWGFRLTLI